MNSYSCCNANNDFNKVELLSTLLKVVTEPNRLKILCILKKGTHCVCEFDQHISLSQSLLSHHLADLRKAGLIIGKKRGLNVHYSLTEKGGRVVNNIFVLEEGL